MKQKKNRKRYKIILFLGILIFGFMIALDYTYNKHYHDCYAFRFFKMFGISRTKALSVLGSNLGVLVTMLSVMLNMGISIKDRLENKVFGIPRKDLVSDNEQTELKIIKTSVYFYPVLMILFLNKNFCASGYIILIYNYLILIFNYYSAIKSYDTKKSFRDVICTLLSCVEDDDLVNERHLMEYQSMLGDVRRGIDKEDGWRNAELLSIMFFKKIMGFDYQKCYILSYYYIDGIFSAQEDYEELRFTKTWISEMLVEKLEKAEEWNKQQLILWSILNRLFLKWKEDVVISFLVWFLDFSWRSIQIKQLGNKRDMRQEMKKQAGIVLIFTESWLKININSIKSIQYSQNLYHLWEFGCGIFRKDITFFEQEYTWLYDISFNNEGKIIKQSIEDLKEDYIKNRQRSHICDFIAINREG